MEDLFKKLGEITKPEKQGGFFDLPKDTRCKDKSHNPPTHIYIPQGKGYRHVCPSCGKVTELIPPQISFWNVVVAITANGCKYKTFKPELKYNYMNLQHLWDFIFEIRIKCFIFVVINM